MFITANNTDGTERIINLDNVEQIFKACDNTTCLVVKGFDSLFTSNRPFDELWENLNEEGLLV